MRGVTKWDKPTGVRALSAVHHWGAGGRPCNWHEHGVPVYAQGGDWADPNCPACKAKVAAGKVSANAPRPREFMLARKMARIARAEQRRKQVAHQRAYYATIPVREAQ